jgi:hypothetical protein
MIAIIVSLSYSERALIAKDHYVKSMLSRAAVKLKLNPYHYFIEHFLFLLAKDISVVILACPLHPLRYAYTMKGTLVEPLSHFTQIFSALLEA